MPAGERRSVRQPAVMPAIKQRVSLLALAFALSCIIPHPAVAASTSTRDLDPGNIEVIRKVHRFRHWQWSGIFPFYGGWIPDPHFMVTPAFDVPEDVGKLLADASARYQGVDVNPWFEDTSSEILIAIESNGVVHEYSIPNEVEPALGYGFINNGGRLFVFPFRSGLAFLTLLDIDRYAFILVPLPLRRTARGTVVFDGSSAFDEVVAYLADSGRYRSLQQNPCRGLKDFFERFESCPN